MLVNGSEHLQHVITQGLVTLRSTECRKKKYAPFTASV